jgi:hypothetical protein
VGEPPEARLLACALLEARRSLAVERRSSERNEIDADALSACRAMAANSVFEHGLAPGRLYRQPGAKWRPHRGQ